MRKIVPVITFAVLFIVGALVCATGYVKMGADIDVARVKMRPTLYNIRKLRFTPTLKAQYYYSAHLLGQAVAKNSKGEYLNPYIPDDERKKMEQEAGEIIKRIRKAAPHFERIQVIDEIRKSEKERNANRKKRRKS